MSAPNGTLNPDEEAIHSSYLDLVAMILIFTPNLYMAKRHYSTKDEVFIIYHGIIYHVRFLVYYSVT